MAVCYQFLKHINDYIDNDIDQTDLKLLNKHMAECDECRLYVERSKAVKHSLSALPRYKTSSSFDIVLKERLRNEIKQEKTSRWSFFQFNFTNPVRIPAMAAGAFAIVVIGLFISQPLFVSNDSRQPAVAEQDAFSTESIVVPASQSTTNDHSLKMRNYVNVREQFHLDGQYSNYSLQSNNASGRIERSSNNDSIRAFQSNTNDKPLIRQANSTVHF